MKLIVAGGRNYHFTDQDYQILADIVKLHKVTEIVHGGASGADSYAAQFAADDEELICVEFPADWYTYKKSAGPLRNIQMAKYADALLVFPGGIGTQSMLKIAKTHKLKIFISSDFNQRDKK